MLSIEHSSHTQGRWGMALFLSRGFAAWMHAWTQAAPMQDKNSAASTLVTVASVPLSLPGEVQAQMVSALASMVLDALRKEAA